MRSLLQAALFFILTPSLALASYTGPVTSAGVQAAIDALPMAGGIIELPCGTFSGAPLAMRDNVVLKGSGPCTIIPRVTGNGEARNYGFGLHDLIVDGAISSSGGYCIDWRNVSNSAISHVIARGCTYGLVLDYSAFYNDIRFLFVDASVVGVEVHGGANQNVFTGGRWSAPTGLVLSHSNGNTFVGVALERPEAGMTYKVVTSAPDTRAVNVRQESGSMSATFWNQ